MTDQEKLTTATDALRECEVLSRSPMPFQAIVRLVEIHQLASRKLAELGIATAAGPSPEPESGPITNGVFEAEEIAVGPYLASDPTVKFFDRNSYVGQLEIKGPKMRSVVLNKRYRITITEEPCEK
jgi:hypothetical protein